MIQLAESVVRVVGCGKIKEEVAVPVYFKKNNKYSHSDIKFLLEFDKSSFSQEISNTWINSQTLKSLNELRDDMQSRLMQSRVVHENANKN